MMKTISIKLNLVGLILLSTSSLNCHAADVWELVHSENAKWSAPQAHSRVMGQINLISSPESLENAIVTLEGVSRYERRVSQFGMDTLQVHFKSKIIGLLLSGILPPEHGTYLPRLGLQSDGELTRLIDDKLRQIEEKRVQLATEKAAALAKEEALRAEALKLVEPVMASMQAQLLEMNRELMAMKARMASQAAEFSELKAALAKAEAEKSVAERTSETLQEALNAHIAKSAQSSTTPVKARRSIRASKAAADAAAQATRDIEAERAPVAGASSGIAEE